MYTQPDGTEWVLPILQSLMEIKQDNWELIFNEEEGDGEFLEENDIETMIFEVCTT